MSWHAEHVMHDYGNWTRHFNSCRGKSIQQYRNGCAVRFNTESAEKTLAPLVFFYQIPVARIFYPVKMFYNTMENAWVCEDLPDFVLADN